MADGVDFELTGLDNLLGTLDTVTYDMKRKGGRFALRKAAQVVQKQAQANARRLDDPATEEDIAENIAVRWSGRTFKRTGNLMFRIGVRGGARSYANTRANVRAGRAGQTYQTGGDKTNPGGDTWYWRLLEFGTENMAARPFMRPAATQAADAATSEFITQYEKALARAIRRANRRAAS